jgi:TRAP-type mannitol/chloroaromatic compound transport system substrate-binding protein
MTSFYGPNAAFYSTGPGSAKDLIKRIDDMSGGRIKIQFYGAGELIPAGRRLRRRILFDRPGQCCV